MSLTDWLTGKLSVSARIWTSVGPAVAILAILALGLVVYAVRNARRGAFHDEEMDHRGLGGLIGARARHFFAWIMRPLWRGLALAEVPPNAITTLSFGLAIAAGVAVAAGRFALGGWLFVGAGALDFLDGRVARETGKTSPGGAALDSVLDRYVESALLVGLAWFYRDGWVLAATLFAITGSLFVPYVRAKGEALGAVMKDVGFMQRPERILVLGLTVAFAPAVEVFLGPTAVATSHRLAIAGILLVAATSHVTAIQRLVHLVAALSPKPSTRRHQPLPRMIVASALATATDFAVVSFLVEVLGAPAPFATVIGCVVGGTLAFTISRVWAFEATEEPRARQAFRYVFVSATSAALNGGGVAVLLMLPEMPYQLAWVVARGVVFGTWNYPLVRDWVFSRTAGAAAPISSAPPSTEIATRASAHTR